MSWVFILVIVGAGLVAMAVVMWRPRGEAAALSRALDAVTEASPRDISAAAAFAVRGRASAAPAGGEAAVGEALADPAVELGVESGAEFGRRPLVDPINGREVAWWDLRLTGGDGTETHVVYAEGSGPSFIVAGEGDGEDGEGGVRVSLDAVQLRAGANVHVEHGTPTPEIERYLQSLSPERFAAGAPEGSAHRRRVGTFSLQARHRYVPAGAELSVIGHFQAIQAIQATQATRAGGEAAKNGADLEVASRGDLPAIVTEEPLATVVEKQRAILRRHETQTGRVLFVGVALLVVAVIKALDQLG